MQEDDLDKLKITPNQWQALLDLNKRNIWVETYVLNTKTAVLNALNKKGLVDKERVNSSRYRWKITANGKRAIELEASVCGDHSCPEYTD